MLAAVSFYLFPFLVGRTVVLLLKQEKRLTFTPVEYFITGSLILFSLTFLAPITPFFAYFLRLIYFLAFIINLTIFNSYSKKILKYKFEILWIFLIGILVYSLWRLNTAYPLPLNWDFFHHQTLVNQISSGHFSFLTTHLSDTFRFSGYSTLFHALLAWPQIIFRSEVLSYLWWLEFLHLLTTLSAAYFLAWRLLKSRIAAMLTTIFSGFIFESYMIYSSLLLIPQTLVAVVFAFLIVDFISQSKQTIKKSWLAFFFLIMLHYIIGLAAVGILLIIGLLRLIQDRLKSKNLLNLIILAAMIITIILSQVNLPLDLEFLNRGEAVAFNYNLVEKIDFLRIFSGSLLFCLIPLGIIVTLLGKNKKIKILLFVSLAIIGLVVLELPYTPKFYVLAHYPVSLLAAYGFLFLLNQLKNKVLKVLTLVVLILTVSLIFTSSASYVKNLLKYPEANALLSPSEIQAGKFLTKEFKNKNVLLISDPATQQVLESLSGINSQGGAYADEKTRKILNESGQLKEAPLIRKNLEKIQDLVEKQQPETILFILSGRYFSWQDSTIEEKMSLSFNAWAPKDLTINDIKYAQSLDKSEDFDSVFENKTLIILKVKTEVE